MADNNMVAAGQAAGAKNLLGAGLSIASLGLGGGGIGGGLSNLFGSRPSYGGGNMFSGDAYGGSASNPLRGLTAADYG